MNLHKAFHHQDVVCCVRKVSCVKDISFMEYVTQCPQHSEAKVDSIRLEEAPLGIGDEARERLWDD